MENIVYKTKKNGERLSLENVSGYFDTDNSDWIRIDDYQKISLGKGDYICFSGADLSNADGIYEITKAECGVFEVKRV